MNKSTNQIKSSWVVLAMMLVAIFGFSLQLKAQNEDKKSKIKIKVTTEENGNSKTFEKEYDSQEEMLNDPDYKEFFGEDAQPGFLNFQGKGGSFNFNFDEDGFYKKLIDSVDWSTKGGRSFFFKSDGDDHFFKLDSSSDHKGFQFFFDDQSFFDSNGSLDKLLEQLEEFKENGGIDSFFFDDSDDIQKSKIKELLKELEEVNEEGGKISKRLIVIRKKVVLKDLEEDDKALKKISKKRTKTLELDDFQYYPNPSNGKFSLRFKMDEESPLSIKIYNLSGKEIYVENYDSFSGSFKSEIDLARQEKGIYLLEISQGKKVLNKKLILE